MQRIRAAAVGVQEKNKQKPKPAKIAEYEGSDVFISSGSTLLDLAISGGRVRGGGIPGGILVEVFGPSGAGKTVLLCEIAGGVQRQGGQIMFRDPEARLNQQFAAMFDLDVNEMAYDTPSTVPEVFGPVRKWNPQPEGKIHGIFADSLAALSTNLEMDNEDGDKMGMRRAKEFSEECRKTCRIITERNFLMVCSNQVRQNLDAGPYGEKYKAPGGEAFPFYASLRLRFSGGTKMTEKKTIKGKEHSRVVGIESEVFVHKSSVWKPYRSAPLIISFDYGVDDIRANLQYVKSLRKATTYVIGKRKLGTAMKDAIEQVEEDGLIDELREETIDLWEEVEAAFTVSRKPKRG
jgi:RecA/RadA recombinase